MHGPDMTFVIFVILQQLPAMTSNLRVRRTLVSPQVLHRVITFRAQVALTGMLAVIFRDVPNDVRLQRVFVVMQFSAIVALIVARVLVKSFDMSVHRIGPVETAA